MRRYFEAYEDRYQQVHSMGLAWASEYPTPIVEQVINQFEVAKTAKLLEIGCGEGRDAQYLLRTGYDLLATDISTEAIAWCQKRNAEFAGRFQCLDCMKNCLNETFDLIYAVAVLHMLVEDNDRKGFYEFFRKHLKDTGLGLICTMGDGEMEFASDISEAFQLRQRTHQQTGSVFNIAATSCRVISMKTFRQELEDNGLRILELGKTASPPDFSDLMYAVVKR